MSQTAFADSVAEAEKNYQDAQAALADAQAKFLQMQIKYDEAKNASENKSVEAPAWTPQTWLKALKAMPVGDPAKGEMLQKEAYCSTCHGLKGIPQTNATPALAGQIPAFTYKALLDYKSGLLHIDNKSLAMKAAATALTKQDMADLAVYYSQQQMPAKAKPAKKPNIPLIAGMCAGCHGSNGEGGANNSGPALEHLNAYYLNRQLKAFQKGERKSEVNHMMGSMMSSLSDKQVAEIVAYLSAM